MCILTNEAGDIVRRWRKFRQRSQEDIAARADISTRHLSFVENGRTLATAATLKSISAALHMSQRDKNSLLLAAGFAPESPTRALSQSERDRVQEVVLAELTQHQPFPAFATDDCWNIFDHNDAFEHVFLSGRTRGGNDQANWQSFAHLVFNPNALRRQIGNWNVFSAFLTLTMRRDSFDKPSDHPIHALLKTMAPWAEDLDGADIVEPYELSAISIPLMFSMADGAPLALKLSVFGFASPVARPTARFRIAKFSPADAPTKKRLQTLRDDPKADAK